MSESVCTENKQVKRKFHDAWAFFLYIVFFIILNSVYVSKIINENKFSLSVDDTFLRICFINFGLVFIFFSLFFLLARFSAKLLIYLGIFAMIGVSCLLFLLAAKIGGFANVIGALNLIILLVILYNIFRHIDYIAVLMKNAGKVLSNNLFSILSVTTLTLLFTILQTVVIYLGENKNDEDYMSFISILFMYWSLLNTFYFTTTFACVIVDNTISGIQNLGSAFLNSFFALGSICFAGFILALVLAFENVVDRYERSRRNDQRGNFIDILIYLFAKFALHLIGEIIKFANSLAFPYLALNGTSYKESVVESFELISNSFMREHAALSVIEYVNLLFNIVFLLYLVEINYLLFSEESDKVFMFVGVIVGFCLPLALCLFSFFRSSILTLIFLVMQKPELVDKYDPGIIKYLKEREEILSQ